MLAISYAAVRWAITLRTCPQMLGEDYSIIDMDVWGWARAVPFIIGAEAWVSLPDVKRLLDSINERPAAQRAEALKEKFQFKSDMDESARKAMFPQNERLVQKR